MIKMVLIRSTISPYMHYCFAFLLLISLSGHSGEVSSEQKLTSSHEKALLVDQDWSEEKRESQLADDARSKQATQEKSLLNDSDNEDKQRERSLLESALQRERNQEKRLLKGLE